MTTEPWRKLFATKDMAIKYLLNLKGNEAQRSLIADQLNLTAELRRALGQQQPAAATQTGQEGASKQVQVSLPTTHATASVVTLRLPWPPSVNHYYEGALVPWHGAPPGRPKFRAVNIVGKKGKQYARDVCAIVDNLRAHGPASTPTGARLRVTVTLHAPTRAKYDVDNRMKGLLDAMTKAEVYEDDSLIDELISRRGPVVPEGCAVVTLEAISATLFNEVQP